MHGAVGPGNVVVGRRGDVRLIDPSPHLYDDPLVDEIDLARLDPTGDEADAPPASAGWHLPSLAGATAITAAAGAAAWWAWHATQAQ